jgi:putative MATE family efflux protein
MSSDSAALMTRGPIYKQIISFALPLFWGQLFQQLYNIVDSIVVGNYVGRDALAAVSSSSSFVQLLVGLFVGIFMGAGVVISKYFGARDEERVHRAIHSSVAFGITAGAILTAVGLVFTPQLLRWMETPEEVLAQAILYLRIYFAGALFLALFNTAGGIFQAVGDSKHPLYYLIFSSVLNVGLDLLFVAVLDMGIAGAAWATVISQGAGAFLAFSRLHSTDGICRVEFKKVRFDRAIIREILRTGLPSGVQNSVISFANVVVQANINTFGPAAVAGYGASCKIEGFVFIPITSFAMAMTTYISQNLGAKKYGRAKRGAAFGIVICCLIAELVGLAYYFFAPFLVSLFNSEPEVIALGTQHAQIIAFFFFLLAFSHVTAGIMRGAGRAVVPMLVMFGCWCVIRVAYIVIVTKYINDIRVVYWAYPITWTLGSFFFIYGLLGTDWIHGLERNGRR